MRPRRRLCRPKGDSQDLREALAARTFDALGYPTPRTLRVSFQPIVRRWTRFLTSRAACG